ncbi:hypothetical protein EJ08DRAFT_726742 [Tothia fuscella]|uniref:Uncharacterized protein n=1 Tax=Tothia fuscella TaxID=1048955 RepID=A0A9P4NYU0_9PEZI|nr:hypothetical protein EJ08DRAFT_726742 [Tothia fuscella]
MRVRDCELDYGKFLTAESEKPMMPMAQHPNEIWRANLQPESRPGRSHPNLHLTSDMNQTTAAEAQKLFTHLSNLLATFNTWYQPELTELQSGILTRYNHFNIKPQHRAGVRNVIRRSSTIVSIINNQHKEIYSLFSDEDKAKHVGDSEEMHVRWEKNLVLDVEKEGALGWFGEAVVWAMNLLRMVLGRIAVVLRRIVGGEVSTEEDFRELIAAGRDLFDTVVCALPVSQLPKGLP